MSGALVLCEEEKKSGDPSCLSDFFLSKAKLRSTQAFPKELTIPSSGFTLQEFISFYELALKDRAKLVALFDWMERTHDYVQYFFPLIATSGSNRRAATVQPITVKLFKGEQSSQQQLNLIKILKIMLHFMGLALREGESSESEIVIEKLRGPAEREDGFSFNSYFSAHPHNYLRFSRMVQSLITLGLEKYALALFRCLIKLYGDQQQSDRYKFLCVALIAPERMGLVFDRKLNKFCKEKGGWEITPSHKAWLLTVRATFNALGIHNKATEAFDAYFFSNTSFVAGQVSPSLEITKEQKAKEVKDPASLQRITILEDTLEKLSSPEQRDGYKKQARANHVRWEEAEKKEEKSVERRVQVIAGDWGAVTSELSKRTGNIYAVLNMANAYVPGGGYLKGMIAQEENMFRRTDCHFSISEAEIDAKGHYTSEKTALVNGENGCVYLDVACPRVCIKGPEELKGDTVTGYQDLTPEDYFLFFELCSAADDLRGGKSFDKESMRRKIRAQLDTLKQKGIRHVVLSAFGCGAFKNPPEQVAQLYKEELEKMPDCFDEVVFAIYNAGYGKDNYKTFYEILQGVSLSSALSTTATLPIHESSAPYDPRSSFERVIIRLVKLLAIFIVAAGLLELIVSGVMALITHATVFGISVAMGPSIIGFAALLLLAMSIIYYGHKASSEKSCGVMEPVASFVPSKPLEFAQQNLGTVIPAQAGIQKAVIQKSRSQLALG